MARLPIVGGDAGNWGTILNEYLQVSHASDGTISAGAVGATQTNLTSVAGGMLLRGTFASRPAAAAGNANLYYLATDNNGGTLYQSTGSAWVQVGAGAAHGATHSTGGPDALSGNLDAIARLAIAKAGSAIGSRRRLNFIDGTNVSITPVDDSGNEEVDVTIGLTGSVAVANGGTAATTAAGARTNLAVPEAAGFAKISVGTVAPSTPAVGDLWVDIN
ncbi:MAG: hypothetical protein HZB75_00310 [Candidatus Saccharibacteria bacterium]|jgi:hypothetical protein|nr:MAG: hypothetical protein HZB75_00310 [Candidatus Saccharibacteria bacterium]